MQRVQQIRVESHRSSPTKLYDFVYDVDVTRFPIITIKVSAKTISTVSPKRFLAMTWKAYAYVGEQYPKLQLTGRVCTSQYTLSPSDLDFTSTSKDHLELVVTNISAFPLSLSIKPTSHHISVSCTNISAMLSGQRKVIQVSTLSADTFWTSQLKLYKNNNVSSEKCIQAYGSPVPSNKHVEMSCVSFPDVAYTSVVSRLAVTITNTSESKTMSNMRLSTSNPKCLWFEFMSEYSSDDDDDEEEEEEEDNDKDRETDENNDTERPQRTKSMEQQLVALKHDDDPERSELLGTDADAFEDEDDISFRRHPRDSNSNTVTTKKSDDMFVVKGLPSKKHRRNVEDLPKLGPQRTMTLNLCFCAEASESSHLISRSEHFRVFLHGEQNVVLCSVAGTIL